MFLQSGRFSFDGKNLPFSDDSFDCALLSDVLHHVASPEALLREVRRVARRVIVHEGGVCTDTFRNMLTFAMDSLLNFQLFTHPFSHKTDKAWRRCFDQTGWEIIASHEGTFWIFFTEITYVLTRRCDEMLHDANNR